MMRKSKVLTTKGMKARKKNKNNEMFNKIICLNDRNKDKNKKYRKYLKIIISCSKSIIKKK